MPYCGFCGRLCPTTVGLKRHIERSSDCKKASHEEFGQYTKTIWDDIPPNPDNVEQQPLPELPNDMLDFLDFQLEEDIKLAEEALLPMIQHQLDEPQPLPQLAEVDVPVSEEVNVVSDSEGDGAHHIENFPEEHLVGATWGCCKPLFESLDEEQKRVGGSCWAPFEDEDEWELAEWLIRNVGKKQTDAFLKLPIVSFIFLFS